MPQPRIVGGEQAPKGQWPFAAYLDQEPGTFCGGSLIGARWVLTAAHCLRKPTALTAKIWLGEEKRPFSGTAYAGSEAGGDFWVHPDYDSVTKKNDVALIRLDRSAPQRAVSLVLDGNDEMWQPTTVATIIGWGQTKDADPGSISDDLLQAKVPVLSNEACALAYPESPGRLAWFDARTMVCAGGETIDSCQGDSGGPIMVPYGIHWFQFGVVSWGDGCAKLGKPGIYSRLETLAASIVARLESDSEAPVAAVSAETGGATPARDSVTVTGTVETGGLATLVYFELGLAGAANYTQVGSAYAGTQSGSSSWTMVFKGLEPGTEYAYRVSAWSATGGFKPAERKTVTTLS